MPGHAAPAKPPSPQRPSWEQVDAQESLVTSEDVLYGVAVSILSAQSTEHTVVIFSPRLFFFFVWFGIFFGIAFVALPSACFGCSAGTAWSAEHVWLRGSGLRSTRCANQCNQPTDAAALDRSLGLGDGSHAASITPRVLHADC